MPEPKVRDMRESEYPLTSSSIPLYYRFYGGLQVGSWIVERRFGEHIASLIASYCMHALLSASGIMI